MLEVLAIASFWLFYMKRYQVFKFNCLEKDKETPVPPFYSYHGKFDKLSNRDFGFLLRKATSPKSRRSKRLANLLLLLFYATLTAMMTLGKYL
ncbi:hypothetical protein SAMN04488109_5339 [Chryseolinea serpens]|uniref:Uncharacterized protein n=1 Tax=Chryseolinea serpens TaxID=947013 RepID=A0A1M5VRG3_9BACT|nr:hypothetical protein [Chryseolinea serpens]SHH77842.1 hypothetical protein SAMN04488109_5339 [Chryseolinea serpens]